MRSRLGGIARGGSIIWLFVPAACLFLAAGWFGFHGVAAAASVLALLGLGLAVAGWSRL